MKCPNCEFENLPDAHYCGMCGARLSRACAVCGFTLPQAYRFCIRCGAQLSESLTAPLPTLTAHEPSPVPDERPTPHAAPPDQAEGGPSPSQERAAPLEGERRVATIIVADVHGSTDLLERVGSETWVEMMNHVFQVLEAEIYRYDGRVDQFRGDGLIAFFGTAVAHEDDPERGVLAAMAMQRAVKAYASDLAETAGIELSLRVGVNTGEVIVTSVGNEQTYSENTAMGEAIAVAARMEQAAEPGTVLVSENTYRLVENQFEWLPLGEINVKGISRPLEVYRPESSRIAHEHAPNYELPSLLIGREQELATLLDCVEDLRAGRGGIVLLSAERGLGKSLLLQEMRQHLARQEALLAEIQEAEGTSTQRDDGGSPALTSPELASSQKAREIRGRARSYEQSHPYAIWQDLLRDWLGVRRDEPKEETRARLRREAKALWDDGMIEHYPDLARFLGLPLEPAYAEQIQHLDAESLRQRLFLAMRSWIAELAAQGPLIITLNDMHWADATSLDLLKYCLPLCDYLDLLWLFVFRPDRLSPMWEFQHQVETDYPHRVVNLEVSGLTMEQGASLIEQMIGPDVLPEETETLILQKAEGNPFFIQELVRSLIANGILVREVTTDPDGEPTERWRATQSVTSLSLPDSLQGLLMARIDRLAPPEQQVLQRASVIGSIFWSNVLEAISPDLPNLRTHLTSLQRAQLIIERGRGPDLGVEYIFKSKLIRDAAYDSLLKSQRTTLHLRIAEYLERQYEEDPAAQSQGIYCSELAYHYRHAGQPGKELYYTLQNAERAQEIYANAEAAQRYTHALSLIDQLAAKAEDEDVHHRLKTQRFQVLMGRHKVYYLMAEFRKAREDAQGLLPLARELSGDPTWLIDALLHQPGVGDQQSRAEIEAGIPMAEEALSLSREIGDRKREIESLIAIVNQRLTLSDPSWHRVAEQALELAREYEDSYYEARILVGMGGIYAFSDQPELSMEYLEAAAALTMSEGLEDKVVQMALLNLLGLEYERNGDYYRLLTEYQQERLHASREIGHRPMESQALQACGRITGVYLGDYTAAHSALEECRRILSGTRDEIYPLYHLAHIQTAEADHGGARETLATIRQIGEPIQERAQASLHLVEAILRNAEGARAATRGDHEAVATALESAIHLAEKVVMLTQSSSLVSQQYEMAAHCKATVAYLGLAQTAVESAAETQYLSNALQAAEEAYEIHRLFGFCQIVECVSEEVFFRYSQALAANDQQEMAVRFLRRAYDEMMRKYTLIPPDSHFRRTYLEQVPLHREIRAAYATRVGSILTEGGQVWYHPG